MDSRSFCLKCIILVLRDAGLGKDEILSTIMEELL